MPLDWDTYYEREAELTDFTPENDPNEIQRCLAAFSVFPRDRSLHVLDVGCGDGYFCYWLKGKRRDVSVQGMDISGPRLCRARSKYTNIKFHEGALPNLPIQGEFYDLVSCIEVLEHMEEPLTCIKELERISKKYVLITVPDREVLRDILCPCCLAKFPESGHINSFDEIKVHKLLKKANLQIISSKIYYPPLGATTGRIPQRLGKLLRKIYNFIDPRPGSYIAILAKK
jgi:ubiquinone/menaquinone biosynthesis C-methylase UbiE